MKKITQLTLAAIAIVTLGTSAGMAASFDCRKASTDLEHQICNDPELNRLDGEMGKLYHKAKNIPGMKTEQRNWVKDRNAVCGSSSECLTKETKYRISDLKKVLGSSNSTKQHSSHKGGNVYSPERGIVCDKKGGYCTDSEGISMGYTKDFLGQKAVDKLQAKVTKYDMTLTEFTMSNGIYCNAQKKACFKDRYNGSPQNKHFTNLLFR